MQSWGIILIVLAIIAVIIGIWYSSSSNSYNYDTDYSSYGGRKKHYKNKFVEKSYMPIKLNFVLVLIFAYIVYAMFYNY